MNNISIIVAVYNIEHYLEKCLNSLIKLDNKVIEILCVNDGSTDKSEDIIKKYSHLDKRIRLLSKINGGLSSARNYGIEKSIGDYLIFIDGDDYVFPDKFNELMDDIFMNNKQNTFDTIWTGYIREDWNGTHNIDNKFNEKTYEKNEISKKIIPSILGISLDKIYRWFQKKQFLNQYQEFPSVWRFIYSRSVIIDNNIKFNEKVKTGEDILFNVEYLMHVNHLIIKNVNFYCYVWRVGSLTQNSHNHFFESKKLLIQERDVLIEKIKNTISLDYSKEIIGSLILSKIQMAITLSHCNFLSSFEEYNKYKEYSCIESIQEAYKSLSLKKVPVKYKLPFFFAKYNFDFLLFICLFIVNKFNVHIYPDE